MDCVTVAILHPYLQWHICPELIACISAAPARPPSNASFWEEDWRMHSASTVPADLHGQHGRVWHMSQVLQHPWVAACGGATSRRLSLNAARGAANTAAARRFRHLVHGIAADTSMRPLPRGRQPAPDDDEGTVHSYTSRLKKQQQAAAKSRGYRWGPYP